MRDLRHLLFGLGLALLCAPPAFAEPAHPPMWKVTKGRSTVFLMGSMHILKPSDYPMAADVDDAYRVADKVYFELPPDDVQSFATQMMAIQLGTYHDQHSLQDDVSPALWNLISDYAAKNGMPLELVRTFQPWFFSISMLSIEAGKVGMEGDSGLDMHFAQIAAKDHKPVGGFETVAQQLALFHDAPKKVQVEMLQQAFDDLGTFRSDMERDHDIWRRGDIATLLADARKEYADHPDLYRAMLSDRNRAWIPKIEKELDGGKHETLVIVGALHLAGNDGVVSLLEKDGYAVERICTGCARR